MSQQATRDAILAGKYHGNGLYYDRHITPLCDADRREKAAAADRAIKAARFRARSSIERVADELSNGGPILPEEIAAMCDP
jgi:hypothetical protein